jgi:uncharacterized membrane protein
MSTTSATRPRFDRLDALRGVAVLWMAAFHFSFDLSHLGYTHQDFYRDPVWTRQRVAILSLFLLCAGAGQAVAVAQGQTWVRFAQRGWRIAACAVLVSAGSWLMFPQSYISFGVLHGMAVMLLLLRAGAAWPHRVWFALGVVALALPWFVADPLFDTRAGNWVGLVTHKPITEDWVPVLPWLGVMVAGLLAGRWLLARRPAWLNGALPAACQPLVWLGRHSLGFYMLHQPVFIGGLMALKSLQG